MHTDRINNSISFHDSIFKKCNRPFTIASNNLQLHWTAPLPLPKVLKDKLKAFSVPHPTLWATEWLSVHWFFHSDAQEQGRTDDIKRNDKK